MKINIKRPFIEIELSMDNDARVFKVYTDSISACRSVSEIFHKLEDIERRKKKIADATISDIDRALESCRLMTEEAEHSIEAIKQALEPAEWAKIEDIAQYLPLSTLSQILTEIAKGMSQSIVDSFSEGKV